MYLCYVFQEHCKEHFEEEEKELLPMMEAVELSKSQQEKVMQQCMDVMRETHSHLFRFFMEGLRPLDAMQYLDMIKRYCDNVRVSLMLHMIVDAPHWWSIALINDNTNLVLTGK